MARYILTLLNVLEARYIVSTFLKEEFALRLLLAALVLLSSMAYAVSDQNDSGKKKKPSARKTSPPQPRIAEREINLAMIAITEFRRSSMLTVMTYVKPVGVSAIYALDDTTVGYQIEVQTSNSRSPDAKVTTEHFLVLVDENSSTEVYPLSPMDPQMQAGLISAVVTHGKNLNEVVHEAIKAHFKEPGRMRTSTPRLEAAKISQIFMLNVNQSFVVVDAQLHDIESGETNPARFLIEILHGQAVAVSEPNYVLPESQPLPQFAKSVSGARLGGAEEEKIAKQAVIAEKTNSVLTVMTYVKDTAVKASYPLDANTVAYVIEIKTTNSTAPDAAVTSEEFMVTVDENNATEVFPRLPPEPVRGGLTIAILTPEQKMKERLQDAIQDSYKKPGVVRTSTPRVQSVEIAAKFLKSVAHPFYVVNAKVLDIESSETTTVQFLVEYLDNQLVAVSDPIDIEATNVPPADAFDEFGLTVKEKDLIERAALQAVTDGKEPRITRVDRFNESFIAQVDVKWVQTSPSEKVITFSVTVELGPDGQTQTRLANRIQIGSATPQASAAQGEAAPTGTFSRPATCFESVKAPEDGARKEPPQD